MLKLFLREDEGNSAPAQEGVTAVEDVANKTEEAVVGVTEVAGVAEAAGVSSEPSADVVATVNEEDSDVCQIV